MSFEIWASNNCKDFDSNNGDIEEDSKLKVDIIVEDENDEIPQFDKEIIFESMMNGNDQKETFEAQAIDKDSNPEYKIINYSASDIILSDGFEGTPTVSPFFSITSGIQFTLTKSPGLFKSPKKKN